MHLKFLKNIHNMRIIQKGAEAIICVDEKSDAVIKERIKKRYRIPELDERIRRQRTKREAKLMQDARRVGVLTPTIIEVKNSKIIMEHIDGRKVKDILNKVNKQKRKIICETIGRYIGLLHSYDIIHGDLTTSNFLIQGNDIYLIDFGLGFYSSRVEDKATDLRLLYEVLKSTHFKILKDIWKIILKAYKKTYPQASEIIKRVEKIKERVRYYGKQKKRKARMG